MTTTTLLDNDKPIQKFKPGDLVIRTGYAKNANLVLVKASPDEQGNVFWIQTLDNKRPAQTDSVGVVITFVPKQLSILLGFERQPAWTDFYIILIEETLIAISSDVVANFFAPL